MLLQRGQLRFVPMSFPIQGTTAEMAEPRTLAKSQPRIPAERSRFGCDSRSERAIAQYRELCILIRTLSHKGAGLRVIGTAGVSAARKFALSPLNRIPRPYRRCSGQPLRSASPHPSKPLKRTPWNFPAPHQQMRMRRPEVNNLLRELTRWRYPFVPRAKRIHMRQKVIAPHERTGHPRSNTPVHGSPYCRMHYNVGRRAL
jgi:hypothetical protein